MSQEHLQLTKTETEHVQAGWPIIYTDLDATLFDHATYSWAAAKPALRKAQELAVPVIFITSKTNDEVTKIQQDMHLYRLVPYIVENGGAIRLPKNRFSLPSVQEALGGLSNATNHSQDYQVLSDDDKNGFYTVQLGTPIATLRDALQTAAQTAGVALETSADMSVERFAQYTGLSLEQAVLAKNRQSLEIFNPLEGTQEAALEKVRPFLDEKFVLNIGGRFCQIMGAGATKGSAITVLNEILKKKYGPISTIGLGDAKADIPFLELCDKAYLIQNPQKQLAHADIPLHLQPRLTRIAAQGPEGWNIAVGNELRDPQRRNYVRRHARVA